MTKKLWSLGVPVETFEKVKELAKENDVKIYQVTEALFKYVFDTLGTDELAALVQAGNVVPSAEGKAGLLTRIEELEKRVYILEQVNGLA